MPVFMKIRSAFRSFRKDESGAALVEFVVVMPLILLVMIPGSWEATNALLVKRKTDQIATVLADLATQAPDIDAADWSKITTIVGRIMEPYDHFTTRMRLVGVQVDSKKKIKTMWSYGTASLDPNSLPSGLRQPNSFYVMSATEVDYQAIFLGQAIGDMTFKDAAVMTPRLTSTVDKK